MPHPSEDIKRKVVAAYRAGNSIVHLVGIFGFHRNSIRNWIARSKRPSGFARKRSPGSGRPNSFDAATGRRLIRIISKPASHFGFETDFWTTGRIQRVCREQLKIRVSRMSIHRTLVKFEQKAAKNV